MHNQIDYILRNKRCHSSVGHIWSFRWADCETLWLQRSREIIGK